MTKPPKAHPLLNTVIMRRGVLKSGTPAPKTRQPIRPTRAIGASLQKAAGAAFKVHGRAGDNLKSAWAEIVGETLAHMTQPEQYQPGKGAANNGVLTVRVAGAFSLDIQHLTPQIIERVNAHFGYRAIARLKIVQGPLPGALQPMARRARALPTAQDSAEIDHRVSRVEKEGLRAVLRSLGTGVYTRRKFDD